MIRSMTGFGAASIEEDGARYSVEIRSVNNRFLKSTLRLPDALLSLEAEIDAQIARRLIRGSVTVSIRVFDSSARVAARINREALQAYLSQLDGVPGLGAIRENGGVNGPSLAALLALPGVVIDDAADRIAERARPLLAKLVDQACDRVIEMREREGDSLRRTLVQLGEDIARGLAAVRHRAPEVSELYRERLMARMKAMLGELGVAVREEDVIREVAGFAERTDIAEEITRLEGHLEQFHTLVDPSNREPIGRVLDFLAQEMLREANTIASKSADVDISRRIVEVKAAIDRIKEQSQNAE